jgi:redox-sensitive bicupin YhaK (pirin superfamily)
MASDDPILRVLRLGFPWETADPFLFCVHHDDRYPAGNDRMGPAASLAGRDLGNDFQLRDGWRMYHGEVVPGFPQHPHRGFETVTLVRRGRIDHSDSLGAAARFGGGDAQWLTAGRGIVHSEMFPLLDKNGPNPVELFQIWLNLPRADKLVEPHFAMLWGRDIPTVTDGGAAITIVAGAIGDARPPAPPPHSWAARPEHDVAIWTIKLAPRAKWTLPPAQATSRRTLYFFSGKNLRIATHSLESGHGVELRADAAVSIENGDGESELLLLQGKPIAEPVTHYGPFVMNTPQEIQQAMLDYRRTLFGGWPWPSDDPVHAREEGRFARHADGKIERVE